MNAIINNIQALIDKVDRLSMEEADINRKVAYGPLAFAKAGETPHSTQCGWNKDSEWFYTPGAVKAVLRERQEAAKARAVVVREKMARAQEKAMALLAKCPSNWDLADAWHYLPDWLKEGVRRGGRNGRRPASWRV